MSAARHASPHVPHPIARAYYRYGLKLERRDLGIICGMIQRNEGTLDKIKDNKATQWFLTYKNTPVRVLMSPDFHKIITFLPLVDTFNDKQRERHKTRKLRRKKIYINGRAVYVTQEEVA